MTNNETKTARSAQKEQQSQCIAALQSLGVDVEVMGNAVVRVSNGDLLKKLGDVAGDVDTTKALQWLARGVAIGKELR